MTIYVFGNPDLPQDSLALHLMSHLQKLCPEHEFIVKDPNEEWDESENLTIIDVVEGIDRVTVFNDLAAFQSAPKLTMHDFDAFTNLRLMVKLGKIKQVKIIGLPMGYKGTLPELAGSVKALL